MIALNAALFISGFAIVASVMVLTLYQGNRKSTPPSWMTSLFACGRKRKSRSANVEDDMITAKVANNTQPRANVSDVLDSEMLDLDSQHAWREIAIKLNFVLFWVYIALVLILFIMVITMSFLSK